MTNSQSKFADASPWDGGVYISRKVGDNGWTWSTKMGCFVDKWGQVCNIPSMNRTGHTSGKSHRKLRRPDSDAVLVN